MGLRHVIGSTCAACGRPQRAEGGESCRDCGTAGSLRLAYDLEEIARSLDRPSLERREPWMWRYKELLPLDELAELPHLQVGMTPTYGASRLASWVGLAGLWLKDEGRAPTGSIEDRRAALAVTRARESGARTVALASAGPGAASLGCLAASVGLGAAIFTPAEHARKLAALNLFGASLFAVDGTLEDARRLCLRSCERLRWYACDGAERPFLLEGLKTAGLEIAEQLGERMPGWIALSLESPEVGIALAKGLRELSALGIARTVPKLLGVTLESAEDAEPPAVEQLVRQAIQDSDGALVQVPEEELADAANELARLGAVDADRAGAAAVAGLRRAASQGIVPADQTALALLTGSGYLQAPGTQRAVKVGGIEAVERQAHSRGLVR